jgi:putative phosphotransacetylase
MITIPIEVSARHLHVSQKDLDILFGNGHKLTPIKKLSQPGQFVCEEVVEVQNLQSWGIAPHQDFTFGKAPDHNQIRVLGPAREHTQVELSWSDFIGLGLEPQVVLSGNYNSSVGGIILVGPKGELKLDKGVIIAQRHIHCSENQAKEYNLQGGQIVSVRVIDDGKNEMQNAKCKMQNVIQNSKFYKPVRQITFHNVVVRVSADFDWQMHIDTDEANAAGICGIGMGVIII